MIIPSWRVMGRLTIFGMLFFFTVFHNLKAQSTVVAVPFDQLEASQYNIGMNGVTESSSSTLSNFFKLYTTGWFKDKYWGPGADGVLNYASNNAPPAIYGVDGFNPSTNVEHLLDNHHRVSGLYYLTTIFTNGYSGTVTVTNAQGTVITVNIGAAPDYTYVDQITNWSTMLPTEFWSNMLAGSGNTNITPVSTNANGFWSTTNQPTYLWAYNVGIPVNPNTTPPPMIPGLTDDTLRDVAAQVNYPKDYGFTNVGYQNRDDAEQFNIQGDNGKGKVLYYQEFWWANYLRPYVYLIPTGSDIPPPGMDSNAPYQFTDYHQLIAFSADFLCHSSNASNLPGYYDPGLVSVDFPYFRSGSSVLIGPSGVLDVSGSMIIDNAGTLTVNGGLSVTNETFYVGKETANNTFVISNGGVVTNNNAVIGSSAASTNNTALITGSGSTWFLYGDLIVGEFGSVNRMTIANGGHVTNGLSIYGAVIGFGAGSDGNVVEVLGTDSNGVASTWTCVNDMTVGYGGSGNSLLIEQGGGVSSSNGFIGFDTNASGNMVQVDGVGSFWSNSNFLNVGVSGSGNYLVISGGATVANSDGTIGVNVGSDGNVVEVLGTDSNGIASTWACVNDLTVGYRGVVNQLIVEDGGVVTNNNAVIGSASSASNNSVIITGGGSTWNLYGDLLVGKNGSANSLTISDGGQVTNGLSVYGSVIGYNTGSDGNSVLVSGTNSNGVVSTWTCVNDLTVGWSGSSNSLVIEQGGAVNSYIGIIGDDTNARGNHVLVDGAGSCWSNSNVLLIGVSGSGNTLLITNGGAVMDVNGEIGVNLGSSNNIVTVTGSGSVWTNSGNLIVGYDGASNELLIANGAKVYSSNGYIGYNSGATSNQVLVTGNGSLWSNSSNLVIGDNGVGSGGSGVLTIQSGAVVQASTIDIVNGTIYAGSTNALGSSDVILGGTTNAATLSLATNLTISTAGPPHYDLTWGSNGVIALAQGTHTLTLGGMTNAAGTNDGVNVFQFLNSSLSNGTNVLINYGSLSDFTTNNFRVQGVSGYSFSTSGNQISAYLSTNANVVVSDSTTINTTLTVASLSVTGGATTVVAQGGTLNSSGDVLVSGNSTLDVNGLIVTPTLTVDQGSILKGVGTLQLTGGNLTLNGTFAPGNSPGTFFVTGGNLVMGSTAVWDEQVYSASVYDRVVVTGAAFLNGTMNITGYGSGGLEYGQKLNFLTASAGISGSFTSIIAPEGFRGRLLISGTEANILIAPSSYTLLARGHNQLQVARALDSFIPATSGDRLVVSTSLDSLTANQYNQAFNAIMPTMYQSMATIAFNEANALNMELNQRLWGVRLAEGGGFSMSGFADNTPMLEGQGDGKGVLDSKKDILRPGLDNHWGMFVDANGIFANANSANMLPGYNAESGGITAGLTYKWNENFASGIYTGYQGTYSKMGASGSGLGTGSTLIDNAVRFGVFGTYGQKDGKGLYLNGLAGGAYHNYQATRVIQYTGMNRAAKSSPGAGELDTMLATGYDIQKGKFTFGPTASLQYTYLGVNGVNETGAQSLNFNSGGWNSSSMLSSVGGHVAYNWMPRTGIVVVPQLSLSWQHEFLQNPYDITGNLGGTSPTFSNTSATGIRDYLYTGVGFTVEIGKKWNTSFFYNAAAGNSDLTSQNIFWSAGVKF
jgi:T5SS/PEP-CTERM-associated repeat protein